jgi:hypothetical protein
VNRVRLSGTAFLLCIVLASAGCSVAPAPAWKADTRDALDAFTVAYFAGNTKSAEHAFAEARAAVSGTGRADLVGRVELVRCAIGTAALDEAACAGADALHAELAPDDQAYADFIAGKSDPAQAGKLPEQYRSLAQAKDDAARLHALAKIEDPTSRLVAAGALFRAGELSPVGVSIAVDTASAQGWRHPLLAWLNVQAKLAEAAGDAATLDAARKRIDLVANPTGRKD